MLPAAPYILFVLGPVLWLETMKFWGFAPPSPVPDTERWS